VADTEELDRAGQRKFVEAFTATVRGGASGRKRRLVAAGVVVVVVSAGVAVAVGVAGAHQPGRASADARLSTLGGTASPKTAATAQGRISAGRTSRRSSASHSGGSTSIIVAPGVGETATAAASAPASSAPDRTVSFKISGEVSCVSGNSVEGVWVQASDGAGWAPWQGLGNGSTSTWWYTLPKDESYSLHVGCGGTTSNWAVATYTPTVTGSSNSFNCYDVAGQADYGTCALS
jgi:hypothetical protein